MNTLQARLSDASRSGVYRAGADVEIVDAARIARLAVSRVDLRAAKSKGELLSAFAQALSFPDWFGGNWDALEDCLSDLSWLDPGGRVLLIDGAGRVAADERGVLVDILASAAESWAGRGIPFFAVFLGAAAPALPDLIGPSA